MVLLTRDTFRESVFKRDRHCCVICGSAAKDAHHIIDRSLFDDGGYYLSNGASLCEPCHIKAETNVITCEEIRKAANITEIVLPDGWDPEFTYNKWGESQDENFSRKYGRTYHYPFSPGTTSDDRINHVYWNHVQRIPKIVHTEKLDGENTCISKLGVFARSHAAPTRHRWADYLKIKWDMIKNDLGDLEIFGENCYAIHSIKYIDLPDHFFVFRIRNKDKWLSWEETKFYAALLDLSTVPVIRTDRMDELRNYDNPKTEYEERILSDVTAESKFGSVDNGLFNPKTGERVVQRCRMEGIVSSNVEEYRVSEFKMNVFKYVRKDHVQTDEHWSRSPRRATLKHERGEREFELDNDKIINK